MDRQSEAAAGRYGRDVTAPALLEHGSRFGKLTVLEPVLRYNGARQYRVGCECGHSGMIVTAGALMNGRKKACKKCTSAAIAKGVE